MCAELGAVSRDRTPIRPTPAGLQEVQGTSQDTRGPKQPPSRPEGHRRVCTQAPRSVLAGRQVSTGGTNGSRPRSQDAGRGQSGQHSAGETRIRGAWECLLLSVTTSVWSWALIPQTGAVRDPWEGQGRKKMVAEAGESSGEGGGCPGGRRSVGDSPGHRGGAKLRTADEGRRGQSNLKTEVEEHKTSFIKGNFTLILFCVIC